MPPLVLAGTIPGFLGGLYLLVACIRKLVRVSRDPVLVTAPLVEEQTIEIPAGGGLALSIDKPQFGHVRAAALVNLRLHVSLEDLATGTVTHASRVLLPFQRHTLHRSRVEVANFHVDGPGTYRLRIEGLAPELQTSESFAVVQRQVDKAAFVGTILATTGAAFLMILGLVASLLVIV